MWMDTQKPSAIWKDVCRYPALQIYSFSWSKDSPKLKQTQAGLERQQDEDGHNLGVV